MVSIIKGYAARKESKTHNMILMHRVINNTPDEMETDHINRDKLDNRKCNLRTCTHSQNQSNKGISKNNSSGYKGVYLFKRDNKWRAIIRFQNKRLLIGSYETAEKASIAYEIKANILQGKFKGDTR